MAAAMSSVPGRPLPPVGRARDGAPRSTAAVRAVAAGQLPVSPVVGTAGGAHSAAHRSLQVPGPLPLRLLPHALQQAEGLDRSLSALARVHDRIRNSKTPPGLPSKSGPTASRHQRG